MKKEKEKRRNKQEKWILLNSLALMINHQEPKPQQPERAIVYTFERKLKALKEMEFDDRKANKLLIKHRGEILSVIQELAN